MAGLVPKTRRRRNLRLRTVRGLQRYNESKCKIYLEMEEDASTSDQSRNSPEYGRVSTPYLVPTYGQRPDTSGLTCDRWAHLTTAQGIPEVAISSIKRSHRLGQWHFYYGSLPFVFLEKVLDRPDVRFCR